MILVCGFRSRQHPTHSTHAKKTHTNTRRTHQLAPQLLLRRQALGELWADGQAVHDDLLGLQAHVEGEAAAEVGRDKALVDGGAEPGVVARREVLV